MSGSLASCVTDVHAIWPAVQLVPLSVGCQRWSPNVCGFASDQLPNTRSKIADGVSYPAVRRHAISTVTVIMKPSEPNVVFVVASPGPNPADPAILDWKRLRPGIRLKPHGPVFKGRAA